MVTPAAAAQVENASCAAGHVCLSQGENFTGKEIRWRPSEGNVFIGDKDRDLVDHVGSFIVSEGSGVCLQDTYSDKAALWLRHERSPLSRRIGNKVDRIRPHDECSG